jgi:hypothetical protein
MKSLAITLFALILAVFAAAKDKEYQMGTLVKVPLHVGDKQSTGYTNTTDCTPGLLGANCTGGIVDYSGKLVATMPNGSEVVIGSCAGGATAAAMFVPCSQPWVFVLTKEDGTVVFLHHTGLHHDVGDKFGATSKVLYREKRAGGITSDFV